ncbi:MAG TPA: hypothetical protein VN213_16115, partial [Solirubrobacteraceae bacterium]|nr:hypothetical protein [Solirubrobacteraceae bacterium]
MEQNAAGGGKSRVRHAAEGAPIVADIAADTLRGVPALDDVRHRIRAGLRQAAGTAEVPRTSRSTL